MSDTESSSDGKRPAKRTCPSPTLESQEEPPVKRICQSPTSGSQDEPPVKRICHSPTSENREVQSPKQSKRHVDVSNGPDIEDSVENNSVNCSTLEHNSDKQDQFANGCTKTSENHRGNDENVSCEETRSNDKQGDAQPCKVWHRTLNTPSTSANLDRPENEININANHEEETVASDMDDDDLSNDSDYDDRHEGEDFNFWWPHSPNELENSNPLENWENVVCNELYRAVSKGDMQKTKDLLARGNDPNQAFYFDGLFDYSALHRAVLLFRPEMVQLLLQAGCRPDQRDVRRHTPFMLAASTSQISVVLMLLKAGADVNSVNRDGRTALMDTQDEETIQMLLDAGADVNLRDVYGSTALHDACTRGCINTVTSLIQAGCDVNIVDREGQTALMCAANSCAGDIASILLDNGADINAGNFRGITALQHAAALPRGNVMMEALLRAGCDADQADTIGHTPLIYAIEMARPLNVLVLIQGNARVEYRFPMFGLEFSPFQLALLQCHEMLKGVAEAEVALTDNEKAKVASLLTIMQLLVVAGARVTARTGGVVVQLQTVKKALHYVQNHAISDSEEEEAVETENATPKHKKEQLLLLKHKKYYADIVDFLIFSVNMPRSLAELCRLQMRTFLKKSKRSLTSSVAALKLPDFVENYILLNELNKLPEGVLSQGLKSRA